MKVKVCGITRLEDALAAAAEGAWAVGFIFHRSSPRYIAPEDAGRIVQGLPAEVLKIGVFVDYPLSELNDVVREARLSGVQLHGAEDPDYAKAVEAATVIKVFRVGPKFDPASVTPYSGGKILLDTYRKDLYGGTGEVFDWSVAQPLAEKTELVLSGGLTPENVADAIRAVRPYALDVSSGVEARPGIKDHAALGRFFAAVREVDAS